MNAKNLGKLVTESLAIEARDAKEAGALGFMARALVQATMPHKKPEKNEFTRQNGSFVLSITAPASIGLPYGVIPRLLLAWVTTEAVTRKSRVVSLGENLSAFMGQLGLVPTGGRWGSITRLREQTRRLFTASVSCAYALDARAGEKGFRIADQHELWWQPKSPHQSTFLESSVTLSEAFFSEITQNPVPIDLGALQVLRKSPMALDIYCWLSYRMSYLSKETHIPWELLQLQFGSNYPPTEQGKRDFKKAFLRELKKVSVVYDQLKLNVDSKFLTLKPSAPHIPLLLQKR